MYLAHNKLPNKKNAIHKVFKLITNYILLHQLLFKLITIPDKEKAFLAIPESCTDKIISLYHNSLFTGHQGVIKTCLTMTSKSSNLPNPPNPPPTPPIPAHLQNPPNLANQPPNPPNPANPPLNPQPNPPPNPPNQPNPPNPQDLMNLPNPPQPQQLNWSYFKPEF